MRKIQLQFLLGVLVAMVVMTSSGKLSTRVSGKDGEFVSSNIVTSCQLYPHWKIRVNRDYVMDNGTVIPCSSEVKVTICIGGCDTSEIPDYKVPYKIINHPVCTYGELQVRKVRVCGDEHPSPYASVFDAITCVCQPCSRTNTSCESF